MRHEKLFTGVWITCAVVALASSAVMLWAVIRLVLKYG